MRIELGMGLVETRLREASREAHGASFSQGIGCIVFVGGIDDAELDVRLFLGEETTFGYSEYGLVLAEVNLGDGCLRFVDEMRKVRDGD